jgi:predicted transcriptional regulator
LTAHGHDKPHTGQPAAPETAAEQSNRHAWEAEGLVRARASIATGNYSTYTEVYAWIDSLGTGTPLPPPHPSHPRPR